MSKRYDNPDIRYDFDVWPELSVETRLWMNKLYLAERMGYECGPTGMNGVPVGDYCIRPIMNLRGNAEGGFWKHTVTEENTHIPNKPGYCYVEWFEGEHTWSEYVDDKHVYSCAYDYVDEDGWNITKEVEEPIELPKALKGLSKYLLVETIGGNIIEVSFRLLPNEDDLKLTEASDGSWYWEAREKEWQRS